MDLIYTDSNRVDLGIIPEYKLDLAFGKDENDFEIEVAMENACLEPNNFIYYEDTQYGGIIDSINPDTNSGTVKYTGRTWHGIMDSKVVSPDKGQDHLILNGEANAVVYQLLLRVGLTSLFTISTEEDSNIVINNYKFPRYANLYRGLRKMLYEFGGKLNLVFSDGKVVLSVSPYVDYSKDEEWDTSEFAMAINKHFNPVNHLYCLGSGDLKDRHVIELFTDENGGIQDYSTVDEPYMDSQYILDSRNQVFTGLLDRSQVYDYNGAQTAENYEQLQEKPQSWEQPYIFTQYYTYDGTSNSYNQIEREFDEVYDNLTTKPLDWNWNYSSYYYKDGENYKSVDDSLLVVDTDYIKLDAKPVDWSTNYKDYYVYYSDGTPEGTGYKAVEAYKYTEYQKQTIKPSDWSSNKGNYYVKVEHWEYTYTVKKKRSGVWDRWEVTYKYKIPTFNKKDYKISLKSSKLVKTEYVKISDLVKNPGDYLDAKPTPKVKMSDFKSWKDSKYRPFYTSVSKERAPDYYGNTYYWKSEATSSPEWVSGKFYAKTEKEIIPPFWKGYYYRKVYDNYADLVTNGIAKLQEYWSLDSVTISLTSDDQEYDVGDVVGATENITNITIAAQITKKIVTIENNKISTQYELGNDDTTNEY